MKWWLWLVEPGGGAGSLLLSLTPAWDRATAERVATALATKWKRSVVIVRARTRKESEKALDVAAGPSGTWTAANPTLVHHGLASQAEWHVVTTRGTPVADIYRVAAGTAGAVAQLLSNKLNLPLMVLSNFGLPKTLDEHSILRTRSGSIEHRPNPTAAGRRPVVGETWRGHDGTYHRVMRVSATTVQSLNLSTGGRESSGLLDFMASHKPSKIRNPKRQQNPGYYHGGTLAADGYVELTRAQWSKIHRDYKGHTVRGRRVVVVREASGGSALYPIRIVDAPARSNPSLPEPKRGQWWTDQEAVPYRVVKVEAGVVTLKSPTGHDFPIYASEMTLARGWKKDTVRSRRGRNPKGKRRPLTVPEKHQLRIAKDTLKMRPEWARIMGGPTPEEAREIIARLTGEKNPRAKTIREGVAILLTAAGYQALARDVRSGTTADPIDAVRFALSMSKGSRVRSHLEKALKLLEGVPARLRRNPSNPWDISAGDRVTIVDRFGKERTGRAVMRSAVGGWVLNMGGAHGTPGLADDRNIVRVSRPKSSNPRRIGTRSGKGGSVAIVLGQGKTWVEWTRSGEEGGLHQVPSIEAAHAFADVWTAGGKVSEALAAAERAGSIHNGRASIQVWTVRDSRGRIIWRGQASERDEALMFAERHYAGRPLPSEPWKATVDRPRGNPVPKWADPRSIRTVQRGRARVRIACPKGQYHARARGRKKCAVGTRAIDVKNPRSSMSRARKTFRMWQDRDVRGQVKKVKGPPRVIPNTLVKLGDITRLDYQSDKFNGRVATYTHKTDRPRPILATDPDGRHVHIVGGRMQVTADGLVH